MYYFVLNEHTLCVAETEGVQAGTVVSVLHGLVLKGGCDWKNGPVSISAGDKIRPATGADFDTFRVLPPKSE